MPAETASAIRSAAEYSGRARRFGAAIALACAIVAGRGLAQTAAAPDNSAETGVADEGTSPVPPAMVDPDAGPDPGQREIVVTARRWGQAEIAAETELDEDEIGAYGADNIGELIDAMAPLIDGSGDAPAVLVNGKRIASPAEITGYPAEALHGVAILPPEAAANYGYPSGQRVVNLELKQEYASWDASAGVTVPTAGGRRSGLLTAGYTVIDGDTRWNAQVTASDETALLKSARRLPVRAEVQALLPTLPDGIEVDPNRFESVLGEARSLNFNAGVARPLGEFAVAVGVNAAASRSKQLTGIPIGSIVLSPGSPWAPAGEEPITVGRLLGGGALQSRQRSESFGASGTLSGPIWGWQASLSVQYAHSRSNNIYDRGFDVGAVQQRVETNPDFDPYGPWPATPLLSDRSRFRNDMLSATFNASRSIVELPAGQVNASLTVGASRNRSRFKTDTAGIIGRDRSGSDQIDGLWSFTIPVTSRAQDFLAPLGDIMLDLSAEVGRATRTSTRRKWNAGVRWTPFSFLDLRASIGHENAQPSFDQLHGPRFEVVTRLFDFARQEYVQPVRIFGGNPALEGGSIRDLSLNAMMRPFGGDVATFNIGYRKQLSRGVVASFPTLTPDIEAAFPDRVMRDPDGRLLSIDTRPINVERERTEAIASSLTLRYTEKPDALDGALPPPGGVRPWTFSLSVNHSWQLGSEMVIRPGLPVLDRLRNSGLSRHGVSLSLVVGRRGMGVSLNGNWNGAARVRSSDEAGGTTEFRYPSSVLFNLGLFAEPEGWGRAPSERNWASSLRLSLDIQNILNGYRKVSVLGPTTRREFMRDEIDPLGRTIRLSIRKKF